MASLAVTLENTETLSRPSTAQSKGRLVLQVEDFFLANKFVVVTVHEVQSSGLSSPLGTARPQSSSSSQQQNTEKSEALAALDKDDGAAAVLSAEVTGFHVTAVDEVENEYSLFISRQKAEYLLRMEQETTQSQASESSSQQQPAVAVLISIEAMANSILTHLDIIGNRHRDIGKLTCREPQAHVAKKERVVPAKSSSAANGKQKNSHLPSKRQDQRAARSLKTAVKTREAIALAAHKLIASPTSPNPSPLLPLAHHEDMSEDTEVLTPRTRKARKSSDYRLLSRMAVADDKTIWKSELESIHDDPSFRVMIDDMNGKAFAEQGRQAGSTTQTADHDSIASLSTIKRAMPEKKTKHKELQERRDKGRQARLRITRGNSWSALQDICGVPSSLAADDEPTRAATFEEIDGLPGNLVKRLPSLSSRNGGSSKRFELLPSRSVTRKSSLVPEQQPQEPEQFLRKRSGANERRVLKTESIFNEIPGMGVEITTERPSQRGSLLLGSPRTDDVKRLDMLRMQENARRSSLERDLDGTLRRRSVSKAGSRRHSIAKEKSVEELISDTVALLVPSASEPELQGPESVPVEAERSPSPAPVALTLSATEVSAPPRVSQLALHEDQGVADSVSTEFFLTTRRFIVDEGGGDTGSASPTKAPDEPGEPAVDRDEQMTPSNGEPQMKTSRAIGVYALTLDTSLPVENSGLQASDSAIVSPSAAMSPRSARLRSEQTIEIHEEESLDPEGERSHGQDAAAEASDEADIHNEFENSDATGDKQAPPDTVEPASALLSSRQACWADESHERPLPASPRTLPRLLIPAHEENATPGPSSQREKLPDVTLDAAAITDRRRRSLDGLKPISPLFRLPAEDDVENPQEKQLNAEELSLQGLASLEVEIVTAQSVESNTEELPGQGVARSRVDIAMTQTAGVAKAHEQQPAAQNEEIDGPHHNLAKEEKNVADVDDPENGEHVEATLDCHAHECVSTDTDDGDSVDQLAATSHDELVYEAFSPHEAVLTTEMHEPDSEAGETRQIAGEAEATEEAQESDEKHNESESDTLDDTEARQEVHVDNTGTTTDIQAPAAILAERLTAEVDATLEHQAEASREPKQSNEAKRTPSETAAKGTSVPRKSSGGGQSSGRDSSPRAPSKKSRSIGTNGSTSSSTAATDSAARGAESPRRSALNDETKDNSGKVSRKSASRSPAGDLDHQHHNRSSHHSPPTDPTGHHEASICVMKHHHNSQRFRSTESLALSQTASQYHKKWGRWLNNHLIVDKISCLQLEELVLQNPHSEKHLMKLGLRYARWSGTSLAAILLLEHASLVHENAPRTHEYWISMGNAHLDLFLKHRKFLPVSKFHLTKCLQAFTRAFAYIESMADPLLLLRYAICLFWRSGDADPSDLEKADDVFRELFTKFTSFCDKDWLNLLFLRFQTLARLHMYHEAAECLATVIKLHKASALASSPPDSASDVHTLPSPYDTEDYLMMLMHCQQCSGDYLLASATFSTILKARGITQEGSLSDAQYLELWYFLAHKCFHHEEYQLALEFYSIALNFAKDSQMLAAIHYSRGLCLAALGEDANCVTEYKRARNVNRHVVPLVSLADLHVSYGDEFTLLLKKPIRQVIDEVRVNLYDKAVKKLQRLFRRKRHREHGAAGMAKSPKGVLARAPSSLTDPRARNGSVRRSSIIRGLSSNHSAVTAAAGLHLEAEAGENITESVSTESQHERFIARQRVAQDKIRQVRANARFQSHSSSTASSQPHNIRATPTKKIKSMPSEPFASHATSGLLNPDWERPELRRKQSIDAFNKVGWPAAFL